MAIQFQDLDQEEKEMLRNAGYNLDPDEDLTQEDIDAIDGMIAEKRLEERDFGDSEDFFEDFINEGSDNPFTDVGFDDEDATSMLDIMKYFKYSHLPEHLQEVSKPFCDLAEEIATLPPCGQRWIALQRLLESKDAAVRASLDNE